MTDDRRQTAPSQFKAKGSHQRGVKPIARPRSGRRLAVTRQQRAPNFSSLALSLLVYFCLAVAITHPLWLHLADAVPGDIGDPLLNTWILAWDAHALLTDPFHLFDANVFYPLPNSLAYSEHLFSTAALIMPLGLVSGEPVFAYNLSLLLSFPLAGLGMYLLVLRWTHRREAALLAGAVFAFAPYRLAAIAHLQLLTVQWLPFSLLAVDRLLDQGVAPSRYEGRGPQVSPENKYGVGSRFSPFILPYVPFVVFTTMQILASWYLAVFTGLALGLYILAWLVAHWLLGAARPGLAARTGGGWGLLPVPTWPCGPGGARRPILVCLAGLAGAVLVVAGLILLFVLPYLQVLSQLQAARPASLGVSFAARPTDFLAAPAYLRLPGPLTQKLAERPGFTEENTLFLGVIAPLLALAGLVAASLYPRGTPYLRGTLHPRGTMGWRIVALMAILVVSLALTFAGPYRALTRLLPALVVVRVPPRWVIPATFALAGLAGYGAAWLYSGRQWKLEGRRAASSYARLPAWAVCCLLLLLLMAESLAAPLPLAQVGTRGELPSVYYALRQEALREPGAWGVVELPMYAAPAPEFPETKRLYASSLGWWGLVNGYSGFTPARQMALDQALADFPDDKALEALRVLGASGVRYLVVHPGEPPLDRAHWETTGRWVAERGTSLLLVGRFGPDDLYLINPYGDDLIANPTVVTDPYWSTHAPIPVNARFNVPISEGEIRLLAYQVQSEDRTLEEGKTGGLGIGSASSLVPETRLTLYWQASTPLTTSYTVFVHSLDVEGALIDGADSPPLGNHYPTTAWRPGEIVQDGRFVPPGDRYRVGLYDPVSGQRLPAFAADGTRLSDDGVVLVTNQR